MALPVYRDRQVMPVMLALRDSLAEALKCSVFGPVERLDIIPRDRRDTLGCECGRVWMRYAGERYLDLGSSCGNPTRFSVEVAVLRCLPYSDTKELADNLAYQEAADGFLSDASAIRRALDTQKLKDSRVEQMAPYGPQGSCMGTVALVSWRGRC